MAKKEKPLEPKIGAPAYMVSFGDMMTLILCFFILLVSMAQEQNFGMLAKGLGSFIVAVESHGLTGTMSAEEKANIFANVRRRFNLPPESDPERREAHLTASQTELFRAEMLEAMEPHNTMLQPQVALFDPDSATITHQSRQYLDRLADSLRPGSGQILLLDGHALDAAEAFSGDNHWLAFTRAAAVRSFFIETHSFRPERVQARGWLEETIRDGKTVRTVDAQLITPPSN
ncbi:MAG: chemotaxis protein MotB [Chlamydiales bacterium]|jgi:chemotaxis protein MotB